MVGQGRAALHLVMPLPSISWLVSRHPSGGQLEQLCHWPMNMQGLCLAGVGWGGGVGGSDTWGGASAQVQNLKGRQG